MHIDLKCSLDWQLAPHWTLRPPPPPQRPGCLHLSSEPHCYAMTSLFVLVCRSCSSSSLFGPATDQPGMSPRPPEPKSQEILTRFTRLRAKRRRA